EPFHCLVVLEHRVAAGGDKGAARDLERQIARLSGFPLTLVRQLNDARERVQLDREVHQSTVLAREQLSRAGEYKRCRRPHPGRGTARRGRRRGGGGARTAPRPNGGPATR